MQDKKCENFKLILSVGPEAGWDYHFKRAVAWVTSHCGLGKGALEFREDPGLGNVIQIEISDEVVAILNSLPADQVVLLSLSDEFVPKGTYRVVNSKDQSVLLEYPTFESPEFGFLGPGAGQVVIHQGDLTILTLMCVINHFSKEVLQQVATPQNEDSSNSPFRTHPGLEAAVLYRSVDFCCWQKEVLNELSERESGKLWMGLFTFDSLTKDLQVQLLEGSIEKYRESRSCVTYYRRDVMRLLRDKPVKISRARAIRYVLERLSHPFYKASFFQSFFKLCPPELRNDIMSCSHMTKKEEKLVVSHFVAYCETQRPLRLEAKVWWKTQLRAHSAALTNMLAANALTQQVPHVRLMDRAQRNPQRVIQDLLTWNAEMDEPALTEFQKLACLCDYLGAEGKSLRGEYSTRFGELPNPPEVSGRRKARICSQLYSRFQACLKKINTPFPPGKDCLSCKDCDETFETVKEAFAHIMKSGHDLDLPGRL